jgi:excisionase family DNA binding protein
MPNVAPCESIKSATTPPLAAAATRLRRRPGRPRKNPQKTPPVVTLQSRHPLQVRAIAAPVVRPSVRQTSGLCRLLGVRAAGQYLGVSPYTIRNMIRDGRLCPVRMPGLARVLVDRLDLDQLIEAWKAPATAAIP